MTPPSHESLIAAIALDRDRAAFTAIFEHFAPRVKSYLQRRGASAAVAEDMAQDALLTVWRRAHQFDPARAGASAWIFAIARNLWIDRLRRNRLAVQETDPSEEPPPIPLPDALLAATEGAQALRRAVEALPADQLATLQLAFYEDRTHSEIADMLGVPLGTIKSRLRLAMTKLRLVVKDAP